MTPVTATRRPRRIRLSPATPNIRTVGRRCTVVEGFLVNDYVRWQVVHVPAGFAHDGPSVPRLVPAWLVTPSDCGEVAAAVHDYLYRSGGVGRGECRYSQKRADQLMRDLMLDDGVPPWRAHLVYAALRCFGAGAWQSPDPTRLEALYPFPALDSPET